MTRTAVYHGRKNKASKEDRTEYQYELYTSLLKTTQEEVENSLFKLTK